MLMWAFVSNEYKSIVHNKQTLDLYLKLYSYPKYIRVNTKEEALEFIMKNSKEYIRYNYIVKEKQSKWGYADVSYVIDNDCIYVNVDTSKLGNISLRPSEFSQIQSYTQGYEKCRFILKSNGLKDWSISNHVVAICAIITSMDKIINLNIVCPDISVYLKIKEALRDTRSSLSRRLSTRFGEVYWTVKGSK